MHRFLFISLALVCLLAGCSAPQTSDPATDESDNLDAYFEEEPADNEVGSAEFGLQDPMDMVIIHLSAKGTNGVMKLICGFHSSNFPDILSL